MSWISFCRVAFGFVVGQVGMEEDILAVNVSLPPPLQIETPRFSGVHSAGRAHDLHGGMSVKVMVAVCCLWYKSSRCNADFQASLMRALSGFSLVVYRLGH